MFGPNTIFSDDVDITFTHRDSEFFDLYKQVRDKFVRIFGLDAYDILFIPGSASIGVESIIHSLICPIKVIGKDGVFTRRWKNLIQHYEKEREDARLGLYCLFETSCSGHYENNTDEPCIVDAVSAFPYYDIPNNAIAFVTCLNKQLGSYIGLSVIGVRKDSWSYFSEDDTDESYLNLIRYKHYAQINQLPMTAPVYIFQHFDRVLNTFDIDVLRHDIDSRSEKLVQLLGEDVIIGDKKGPAITVSKSNISKKVCDDFCLYGNCVDRPNIQIFTYSETQCVYDRLFEALK